MSFPRRVVLPAVLVVGSVLLGGWFLQEGVSREENVFLQVRLFQEVVDHVSEQYVEKTDASALYESAIDGVLRGLDDPNTSFIEAADWEDFRIRATEGDYGGVGLEVGERDEFVTVVGTIPGGPGERVGIRPGDRFREIAGEPARGMSVDAAVDILRGEQGTEVEVLMERPGVSEPIPFTLTREVIQLRSVPFGEILRDEAGYLPLQVFRTTSSDEVRDEIRRLRDEGATGIILDLRGNPGGLLDEGIDIAELFLPAGSDVVETRGRGQGQSETYTARAEPLFPDIPLVLLVDEASASASEIVAGALQDHDRALLVGAPTYGKGSVQTLFRLTGGNVLRLTTAHWYTPVGRSIQKNHDAAVDTARRAWTLANGIVLTEDMPDRPEFQSMDGRTLLGGGGITPDLWVIQDTLTTPESEAVQALFRQAGLFTRTRFAFAVDWIQSHPGLTPDFRIDGAMVDAFGRALRDAGMDVSESTLEAADRYLRYQLESEISLQAFGEEGRFIRLAGDDHQLQRALDVLAEARNTRSLVAMTDPGLHRADDPDAAVPGGE